jgi:hypothetical protein
MASSARISPCPWEGDEVPSYMHNQLQPCGLSAEDFRDGSEWISSAPWEGREEQASRGLSFRSIHRAPFASK